MFNIETCADFYALLVEDFDDFHNDPKSARRALHVAISAYHLYEWVWGDWLSKDHESWKALGVRDRGSFLKWIDQKCPWFSIVQSLATGGKHFVRSPDLRSELVQGYGSGPYGFGPYGQGYLLLDFGEAAGDSRYMLAAHILEATVRFWRDFFRVYRPDMARPESIHHMDAQQLGKPSQSGASREIVGSRGP